jgi:uncharacterized protein YbjT (DUF2867 family)
MQVAVTTPTGNVGQQVVSMLIRAGLRPRVLVRDPARLDPDVRGLVDAVAVDQGDLDAVVAATAGLDALYWVDPPNTADDPVAEYARVGAVAAQAVRQNDISRTVFQSSIGAEKRHGAGEIDGLARTEELLDATGSTVLHLRCGFFFSNLLMQLDAIRAGVIPVVLPTDQPMAWVAPRDIAEVAVFRLLSEDWTGRQLQAVHGPTDLNWQQAAAIMPEAIGREVRAERVPDDEMRDALTGSGMGSGPVEAVMGMSPGLRGDFVPELHWTHCTTTPTTLRSWCYDVLRPLI